MVHFLKRLTTLSEELCIPNASCLVAKSPQNNEDLGKSQRLAQVVTQVGNEKQRVDCEPLKQSSISTPITHSPGEELSDSEDELLEVLEGVVSSKQEVGALNKHLETTTSLVKVQSELKTSPTPEPPNLLDTWIKGEATELVSNGSIVFNKYLSKSAKRRLKKQAKEESICSFSSGGN
ncbi:hypothetical protein RHSIM_Rhsim06G0091000 [Rhododendron simsii]|uniref:Uncharacterized protein n=1 Tax=Rhododendron simsii TaxID=118357 RepID=A0A834GWI5_RHOSS|nr:hypothetical protein RHSIM_Rhsim06G0091000 [Rhododendron simsii]